MIHLIVVPSHAVHHDHIPSLQHYVSANPSSVDCAGMNRDCLNPENQVELQKTMHEFSNTQFENYDTNLVSYGAYPADDITVVAAAGTDRS